MTFVVLRQIYFRAYLLHFFCGGWRMYLEGSSRAGGIANWNARVNLYRIRYRRQRKIRFALCIYLIRVLNNNTDHYLAQYHYMQQAETSVPLFEKKRKVISENYFIWIYWIRFPSRFASPVSSNRNDFAEGKTIHAWVKIYSHVFPQNFKMSLRNFQRIWKNCGSESLHSKEINSKQNKKLWH